MPVYHVVGNHEQVNLDLKHIAGKLNYPKLYYSFEAGNFHFVVLFSTSKDHTAIHVDEAQRKWLAEDLEATSKPTFVFIHHPIDDQDLTGSFWFEKYPNFCFVEERVEIRETLARSGKVRAVFNGHVHRNNLQSHDGIHYVTVQSLVENMSDSRKVPSESYAVVTFGDDEIRVEVEGMDPAEYRF
jgi:Icc protein